MPSPLCSAGGDLNPAVGQVGLSDRPEDTGRLIPLLDGPLGVTDAEAYELHERLPTPEEFRALREAAGMTPRPRAGVIRGLPNSLFGAVVVHRATGETVAMGRVVGDGGTVFHVRDMAVHSEHQRQGLETRVMDAIDAFLDREAPPGAYMSLMADVDGFYERFGFSETRPASKGMYRREE
jgi:GNAT superfamily N-acetyltransferase